MGWIAQLLPFHRSASVAADWLLPPFRTEYPTAVQPVAEVQATPISWFIAPPSRPGVGWMAQLVPSHRSARLPALECPTAVHTDGEVQANQNRAPPPCGGLAVV